MRLPAMVAGGNVLSLGVVGARGVLSVMAALGVLGVVAVSEYAGQLADDTDEELMK
jgi:hypothetical protein